MKYFITLLVLAFSAITHGQQHVTGKDSAGIRSFQKPQFPGGERQLREFLSLHLHYPHEAMAQHVEGEVLVSFLISEDGLIRNVITTKKLGHGCEEEAERVVKMMPRWLPATRNGKGIAVNYKLPVVFELTTGVGSVK